MSKNDKILGIIGGMGPEASLKLYELIICFTNAKIDQDHFRIIIDSNCKIPDRINFIFGKGEDPLPALLESLENLIYCNADCVLIPCHTSHFFFSELQANSNIPIINMIELTLKNIASKGNKNVGLLATLGTYKAKLYENVAREYDVNIIVPNDSNKRLLQKLIKEIKKGNKSDELIANIKFIIKQLQHDGVDGIILGCTELSLIQDSLDQIDPLSLLAKYITTEFYHNVS